MNEIYIYNWQSFSDRNGSRHQWWQDIHGFESLEDALLVGLEDHVACTEHKMHRVVCNIFDAATFARLGQAPVYYILTQNGGENASI